jgi:hypothetical protein
MGCGRGWAAAGTLLVVLGACRAIAGFRDVQFVEIDGACAPPSLPTQGNGRVRLVNGGTQGGNVDFCIRAAGTSDWGKPVLTAGSGALCDTGLAYAQSTVPFAVPAGTLDVEAIPAGSDCSAAPTSTALGVDVGDTTQGVSVVTLVRYGAGSAEAIAALQEEPTSGPRAPGPTSYALRIVNAVSSGDSINAGFLKGPSLPATLAQPLLPVPIAPGHVEPPIQVVSGFRSIDDEGYGNVLMSTVTVGVVLQGSHDALFAVQTPGTADVQTLFAIGDRNDPAHPIRGLLCEDGTGGADAGAGEAGATGAGALASCVLSNLPSLAVETFNTALYGAQAPFNDQRKPYVYAAIAARSSDLMCLIETASDYTQIAAHAQGHFPYSFVFPTNLDTRPTDPTDKDGNVPPPSSEPACAGVDPSIIQSIYDCVAQNCTETGDMSGTIQTTNCLSGACAGPFLQIYYQGLQQDRCFDCIANSANSEYPLAKGKDQCTNDPREQYAYDGMNSVMMLSRYPLKNTQAFVLPGTGYRRAILYAQVELEDQTVDFFCGQLVSPLVDGVLPYVGSYGTDIAGQENGWEDEQDLQAQKAVAWIQATAVHPAIIAGDWHATLPVTSQAADGGSTPLLVSQSPEVMDLFDKSYGGAFVRAEPTGYQPTCEYCPAPQDVYNTGTGVVPEDFTATFLFDFADGATVEDSLWATDNGAVPLTSFNYATAPAATGPLSPYFGRLVRVLRPKPSMP